MSKTFFVPNIEGELITVTGEEFMHAKVLRKQIGDEIVFFDNSGYFYNADILEMKKDKMIVKIMNKKKSENEIEGDVMLCVGLSKADKMEWIVQKCTELGITKFCFFESEFTTVKASTTRVERLDKICVEACKQCGRAITSQIMPVKKIEDLPEILKEYKTFVAYENEIQTCDFSLKNDKKIALVVGSEGGFSENEIKFLKNNIKDITTISLGKRILRVETACVALSALALKGMEQL